MKPKQTFDSTCQQSKQMSLYIQQLLIPSDSQSPKLSNYKEARLLWHCIKQILNLISHKPQTTKLNKPYSSRSPCHTTLDSSL